MFKENENRPIVVVFCTSFNHGKYIKQTLDSIMKQKTDYSFKIVVHDDASTDNSQEIIREYAKRFPETIIPILQKENQFSKGVNVYNEQLEELMQGKYIAYCECDDYWTDENKLQKQIDYMENHPNCSMCVHNTKKVNESGNDLDILFNNVGEDKDYCAEDVILAGGGGLFHTSSYLYRTELKAIMPDCFMMKKVADYPMAIYMSTKGYIHYMKETMSAYRVAAIQSWSVIFNKDNHARVSHYLEIIRTLKKMDEYTKYQYTNAFQKIINENEYLYLFCTYQFKKICQNNEYKNQFKKNSLLTRIKYIIKAVLTTSKEVDINEQI